MNITVHSQNTTKQIAGNRGQTLLEILRENNFSLYAPCGGKGTCGKCRVKIKDNGSVLSCLFAPDKDMEIWLPEKNEAKILVSQSEYLEDYSIDFINKIEDIDTPYGVAIDIGTTTVVMYFVEMLSGHIEKIASFLNPQSIYGGDVIARISHCQENANGLKNQQKSITHAINMELVAFCKSREVNHTNIAKMTIAANTTMLHLLLGKDPTSIALAPFIPQFTDKQEIPASDTDCHINGNAKIFTLPCISAYVGADIVAGLAAIKSAYKNYLLVDIGTNGELAIVKDNEIYACATAAGPAFEGANLSCGMGAIRGAISMFESPKNFEVIGDIEAKGICGSGIVDIVSYLVKENIVDETGLLQGDFTISRDVTVTQQDIREIQLAKSAIYSGIKILLQKAGLSFNNIEALFLAGGFGNYINIESAIQIGLLPTELNGKIKPIGNSAGIGALQYLKSDIMANKTEDIVRNAQHFDLSEDMDFTMEFAMNMNFSS